MSTPTLVFRRLIFLASYYLSLLKPLCKINHFYQAISDQTDQRLRKIIYYTRLHVNEDVDLIKGLGLRLGLGLGSILPVNLDINING